MSQDLVVFGELGLTGEIRPVPFGEERLAEAQKHGFKRAVVPRANAPRRELGIEVVPVDRLSDALALAHARLSARSGGCFRRGASPARTRARA